MAETELTVGERTFELARPHTSATSPFRAWSAADVLAINELTALPTSSKVLVINETWGAISVALAAAGLEPHIWSESVVNRTAVAANFDANRLVIEAHQMSWGEGLDRSAWADAVVLAPTKHPDLTKWQSTLAAQALKPGGTAFAVSMSKYLSKATLAALGAGFAMVTPRRAVGKARIVDLSEQLGVAVEPVRAELAFTTSEGITVYSLPGVFGGDHIDTASALLLDTLNAEQPRSIVEAADQVVDLGCGNGVIATTLAQRHHRAHFHLVDASDRALLATAATWAASELSDERRTMVLGDGCAAIADASVDLVVSNPPFHQGHAVDTELAHRLVGDGARVLRPDGAMVAVAHRSVDLHHGLSRSFGEVKAVSKHPNFVVLVARNPKGQ